MSGELGYPDSNQERQDQNLQCYHYTIAQYASINLLGYPDSNQERQDQNLQCYHYTIAQCLHVPLDVCGCKVTPFL